MSEKEAKNTQLLFPDSLLHAEPNFNQRAESVAFLHPAFIVATQGIKCDLDFQRLLMPMCV